MTEPRDYKGKVSAVDLDKRILTMFDEMGVTHPFKWTEPLDVVMQKQKVGYYLSLKYDDETRVLKSAHYWSEWKENWKPAQNQKPQWQGKPRNEKIIVLQSSLKVAADLFQCCTTPDTQDYESACELVVSMAIKMTNALMKEGGA